jgi:hypothetical protein
MSPADQSAAVRLLSRWAALAGGKPKTGSELIAFVAEVELLRIETEAFIGHEPPPVAKAAG